MAEVPCNILLAWETVDTGSTVSRESQSLLSQAPVGTWLCGKLPEGPGVSTS